MLSKACTHSRCAAARFGWRLALTFCGGFSADATPASDMDRESRSAHGILLGMKAAV